MIQTQLDLLARTEKFRTLTLWQPWGSLIALGLKKFETRSWGTQCRGKLLIHAAKRPIKSQECAEIMENADNDQKLWKALCEISATPNYGCIVAIADLTDCCLMHPFKSRVTNYIETPKGGHIFINQQPPLELAVGDWQPGSYAWKLENVIAIPQPIPHVGGQGLRYASDELKQRIGEAVS